MVMEFADTRLVTEYGEPLISVCADDTDAMWEKAAAARWNPRDGWHQPLGDDWMYQPDGYPLAI